MRPASSRRCFATVLHVAPNAETATLRAAVRTLWSGIGRLAQSFFYLASRGYAVHALGLHTETCRTTGEHHSVQKIVGLSESYQERGGKDIPGARRIDLVDRKRRNVAPRSVGVNAVSIAAVGVNYRGA